MLLDGSSIWWYTEIDNKNILINFNHSRLDNESLKV